MFCLKCGHQNSDSDTFCTHCGEKISSGGQQNQQFYSQPVYNANGKQPGDGAATGAIVCGIIGLFVAGLILGIIAIVQATKAKKLGCASGKATAGIVLGVCAIVGWAFSLIICNPLGMISSYLY